MYAVLSASRLMKAAEVREICSELRSNPTLLMALELAAKEELYRRFEKEKAASETLTATKTIPKFKIPSLAT
ncbi:hypothetical protein [Parageobacillus thermoglucosidasius]|uniref:Uncharacterized protein n=1 Tax=Parageobacillus thermoglucosidasius TaxID=1426 RepID=A0A1B7KMJ2_PARTM|nr:hypothetical protein [Parageobacillus thermoglucosidasius]OAT71301.1 hypothetical protein A7K69_14525 [Parageobacillus thermoglucosidasius]